MEIPTRPILTLLILQTLHIMFSLSLMYVQALSPVLVQQALSSNLKQQEVKIQEDLLEITPQPAQMSLQLLLKAT